MRSGLQACQQQHRGLELGSRAEPECARMAQPVQRRMRMKIGCLGLMQRKKSRLAAQNVESKVIAKPSAEAVCAQTASR
eukprot:scaffold4239_cov129-Isochrysis_galbana.AAC.1